jgi:4'-phosphopantetheinyl transferase EntD
LEDDDISNEEIVYGMKKEVRNIPGVLNEKRLNRFIGGRVALRRALRTIENIECAPDADTDACSMVREIGPILADSHGAPDLPAHVHGSISHKDNVCVGVAIIADADRVGCDIERCTNPAADMLGNRVLTSNERATLGSIGTRMDKTTKGTGGLCLSAWTACSDEDTMLRFSFKEAIFKAIHPYLARSVDFDEVEVYPRSDGDAEVVFRLKTNAESTFTCTAKWYRYQHEEDGVDYFVTYARSSDIRGASDPNRSKSL